MNQNTYLSKTNMFFYEPERMRNAPTLKPEGAVQVGELKVRQGRLQVDPEGAGALVDRVAERRANHGGRQRQHSRRAVAPCHDHGQGGTQGHTEPKSWRCSRGQGRAGEGPGGPQAAISPHGPQGFLQNVAVGLPDVQDVQEHLLKFLAVPLQVFWCELLQGCDFRSEEERGLGVSNRQENEQSRGGQKDTQHLDSSNNTGTQVKRAGLVKDVVMFCQQENIAPMTDNNVRIPLNAVCGNVGIRS
ncbi:uncharacterized protein LOC130911218 [Corythoichthys intestinalis]|uniref:uncharacterized protein LOC130911218 n=1 Tax=Corythoichthys intestinalis TaxID=161448 RepID=UPI0025A5CF15|nr:uncharacterized protein LOC130911218 [Corythoichthys intestinalis]